MENQMINDFVEFYTFLCLNVYNILCKNPF